MFHQTAWNMQSLPLKEKSTIFSSWNFHTIFGEPIAIFYEFLYQGAVFFKGRNLQRWIDYFIWEKRDEHYIKVFPPDHCMYHYLVSLSCDQTTGFIQSMLAEHTNKRRCWRIQNNCLAPIPPSCLGLLFCHTKHIMLTASTHSIRIWSSCCALWRKEVVLHFDLSILLWCYAANCYQIFYKRRYLCTFYFKGIMFL